MNQRAWGLGLILLGLAGCAHQQTRLQSADDTERDREAEVVTVGDKTSFANADAIPVSGVGLVVGLEGTGGSAPAGGFRTMLEEQLRKHGVEHVKEVLARDDVSMVLITGMIPPGSHKGDPIDLEISLPPGSKTTSLRGGILKDCPLYNYDFKKNVVPEAAGPNGILKGHVLARAEGPLLVGFGIGDEAAKLRQGRIWGGGKCTSERSFYLALNSDQQRAAVAQKVADRINETFHGKFKGAINDIAVAKTASYVTLAVPEQYRHNLPRYLRVVRMIPLQEVPPARSPYRRRISEQLLDPAHTITSALRLEALGSESIPDLKRGLESKHPLVRFAAAEALAYLDDPACGEELAKLIEQQPMLRSFSLTALASLDEAVSHVKLRDLLSSPSAETRYGAFRALRALDEHDPAVQGEWLNESFWVHRVGVESEPLVHLASSRRAEIVLFGEEPCLVPPFSFLAGEFTITASRDDEHCTITRRSAQHNMRPRQCSLKLMDVLHAVADLGGMYPEAVELIRQAGTYQCVSCPVAVDALPQATSVYALTKRDDKDANFVKTDEEILKAQAEFSPTPTLFEKGSARHIRPGIEKDDEEVLQHERKGADDKKTAERGHGNGE